MYTASLPITVYNNFIRSTMIAHIMTAQGPVHINNMRSGEGKNSNKNTNMHLARSVVSFDWHLCDNYWCYSISQFYIFIFTYDYSILRVYK